MNNNETAPAPKLPSGGIAGKLASLLNTVYERASSMSALVVLAVVLVPITVFLVYLVFASSREKALYLASAKMDLAIDAYEKGETNASLEILKQIRNEFPGVKTSRVAEYYEGAILFGMKRDEKSLERIKSFLSHSSDSLLKPESLFMAGFSNFRLERWDEAVRYFEQLISRGNPFYEKRVLPLLATAYMKTGNKQKAEAVYKRFAGVFPKTETEEIPTAAEQFK